MAKFLFQEKFSAKRSSGYVKRSFESLAKKLSQKRTNDFRSVYQNEKNNANIFQEISLVTWKAVLTSSQNYRYKAE